MSAATLIEWTDATWQVVTGCSIESSGCKNCYAMKLAGGRLRHHPSRVGLTSDSPAGPVWTGEVRFNECWLDQPMTWSIGRKVFVCAHGDLFHEAVPDEWLDRIFAVMLMTPRHTFQILTKRAARMRDYVSRLAAGARPVIEAGVAIRPDLRELHALLPRPGESFAMPRHLWLGVSVEDQVTADARVHQLQATPADRRWLSCEPLLGPIDLRRLLVRPAGPSGDRLGVDWMVVGGESGPSGRPMHPQWARDLRDACRANGVRFYFKQWGSWSPTEVAAGGDLGGDMRRGEVRIVKQSGSPDGHFRCGDALMRNAGKKAGGRLLDGNLHNEFPR